MNAKIVKKFSWYAAVIPIAVSVLMTLALVPHALAVDKDTSLRARKTEELRKPLTYAAEPGWTASFAGCVIGQTYLADSNSGVVYGGIVKAYRPRKKLEVPFYGMDTLQLSLTPTSHRIFRIFADRGFTGDRESFLSE